MTALQSWVLPSAFHICPDWRIIAGIEASMMMSLGTWRLVMPRSESTIARSGPAAITSAIVCSISARCSAGSSAITDEHAAPAVVGVGAGCRRARRRSARTPARSRPRTACPNRIGSDTFIIVALRWTENSTPLSRASFTCSARNAVRARFDMNVPSTISPSCTGTDALSTVSVPSLADVLDAQVVGGVHRHRLLVRAEVVLAHRHDVGLRVRRPGTHRVRVLTCVLLDRLRRAAVGVAFAKDRVDGGALDLVVARLDVALGVGDRSVGIVGERVALALELGDGGVELRHRRRDVGELDDVGFGEQRQLAELGEVVGHALLGRQEVGEHGQDPTRRARCRGWPHRRRRHGRRLR